MDLDGWSACLKVFADATRVRLLALLEREELTVAELSAITRLAQPRVSTHLAKLKEAGLVRDRRAGVSAYYRFDEAALDAAQRALWQTPARRQRRPAAAPGRRARCRRCWPTRAARPELGRLGRRRHGAPLLAGPHLGSAGALGAAAARSRATCSTSPPATACWPNCWRRMRSRYVCVDASPRVVAGRRASACASSRTSKCAKATCTPCPSPTRSFDLVLLMHALTYAEQAGAGRRRGRARAAPRRPAAADQPGQARAPRRGRGLRPRQPRLHREGAAQVRRQGRAGRRQLRDGDAREAPAAFRSDLALHRQASHEQCQP